MEIQRLYPQYNRTDRRQSVAPVKFDRRSEPDRRQEERYKIDPQLKHDINNLKNIFIESAKDTGINKGDVAVGLLSPLPLVRRGASILDAYNNQEYIKSAGKFFIQAINVKHDFTSFKKATNDVITRNFKPDEFQRPYSFTRNTLIEGSNLTNKIRKYDKSLFEVLSSNEKGQNFFKAIGIKDVLWQDPKDIQFDKFGNKILKYKVKGNASARILGRAMMRVPLLGVAIAAALEIPSIITEKDHAKQIKKSTIIVSSTITLGAVLGAIGATKLGRVGSIIGLCLGSYVGRKIAKGIND